MRPRLLAPTARIRVERVQVGGKVSAESCGPGCWRPLRRWEPQKCISGYSRMLLIMLAHAVLGPGATGEQWKAWPGWLPQQSAGQTPGPTKATACQTTKVRTLVDFGVGQCKPNLSRVPGLVHRAKLVAQAAQQRGHGRAGSAQHSTAQHNTAARRSGFSAGCAAQQGQLCCTTQRH